MLTLHITSCWYIPNFRIHVQNYIYWWRYGTDLEMFTDFKQQMYKCMYFRYQKKG